ncbi:MAG: putative bifunctional diguanylate cyclase/phosphodiesterase, partial [Acidimicrobiia bacterium]
TARDGTFLNRPLTYRSRHADGSWRWIEGAVSDLRDEPSVGGILINGRDVTERVEAERQLAHLAAHDALTGLPNRWAFLEELGRALGRSERHGSQVAVLFLDLDDFKIVNDTLGHSVGDQLLIAVADVLRATVRAGDTLARLGGDEFTVAVEDLADGTEAISLAERILLALAEPLPIGGRRYVVGASIGIATSESDASGPDELLRRADLAMYRAKELGRNRLEVFDEVLARRARRRLDVEAELRVAIERRELLCHYQPEVSLPEGQIIGMEALVRWRHPVRGLLPPSDFMDVAEKSDLVVGIGSIVIDDACRAAAGWLRRYGDNAPQVAVNVSTRQLRDHGFVASITDALAASGLPARLLRIEVLESLLVDESLSDRLMEIQHLGASVAIDDFGTGYSSLSYLDRLPVDAIKIDRSFLAPVTTAIERAPVVEATIAMASSLGLTVVAEGVETPAHVELLNRLGCTRAQGYFFSRPQPPEEAGRLLAARLGKTTEPLPKP